MLIAVMAGWIQRLSSFESWLGDKVACLFPSALFSSVVTCYHHLSARLSHSFQLGSSEMWLEFSKKAPTKHGRFELQHIALVRLNIKPFCGAAKTNV